MIFPKNLSGKQLIKLLEKLDYQITRQTGSHIRLTTSEKGTHHITIPNHRPIKLGTLSGILKDIGAHFGMSKEEVWKSISSKKS
ncbi:type II toxin-antitoxin system HicA family toxin [Ekhidna sp.]|uniref:type II toxin-antitoxin system HicA family toxin n=1 Tax=Ekhidna sp. TaxID=2608089 RepID=UPI0032ED1C91